MTMELVKCAFVVEKRGRRCRMVAAKGSVYCGEHLIHDKCHKRRRIPCPLDPSHTVFEDLLTRHQKKCNAAKKPRPSCYRHGINTGLVDYIPSKEETLTLSAYSTERVEELIARVITTYETHVTPSIDDSCLFHPSLASELSDPNNGPSALKHLVQQSSILGHLEAIGLLAGRNVTYIEFGSGRGKLSQCIHKALQFLDTWSSEPCCKKAKVSSGCHARCDHQGTVAGFENPYNCFDTPAVDQQHLPDVVSAESANYPPDSAGCKPTPEEEASPSTLSNVHFLLVDRSSCRRKVDGSLRTSSLIGVHYHRLLMDIEHLDLSMVDCLRANRHTADIVAVSKHLCGAATDLTLRCLANSKLRGGQSSLGSKSSPNLRAVLIALCCHHQCSWSQLVGREFFTDLDFSPLDFHIISHMTSWAVCGVRPVYSVEGNNSPPSAEGNNSPSRLPRVGYSPHPNESIGLKCKRLIDMARISFLKGQGFKCRLVYYVDKQTSLENVLLIAT